ncbi:hypothetical protein [Paraburkholderia sp. MM6662-R1]|uniref:hypothetical protein n=1 Tax=Paraburkholderia sp. MM6662-R1 TaxID=2991066 RepID=UPI003D199AB6
MANGVYIRAVIVALNTCFLSRDLSEAILQQSAFVCAAERCKDGLSEYYDRQGKAFYRALKRVTRQSKRGRGDGAELAMIGSIGRRKSQTHQNKSMCMS